MTEINRRILIVDDNHAIHDDFRKVIGDVESENDELDAAAAMLFGDETQKKGAVFEISSAFQGQQALELVTQATADNIPFALAFVDVRMPPGWDGITTVRHLWEVDPDLQVVICTAYSDYSWNEMMELLGETDQLLILKKPFDNIEVRQLACALTTKWTLGRKARTALADTQAAVEQRTVELRQLNEQLRSEVDIRRHSERQLQLNEAKTKGILNTAMDGILAVNEDGYIESCNPAACEIFALSDEDLMSRRLADLLSPPYCNQFNADLRALQTNGDGKPRRIRHEVACRRPDGSEAPLDLAMTELSVESRKMATVIVRDMTEQKQLEGRLLQSQKLESIGQLAAGIAHEINTPMQFVGDNARFLQEALGSVVGVLDRYEDLLQAASDGTIDPKLLSSVAESVKQADLDYLRDEIPSAISQSLEGVDRVATIVRAMKEFSHPGQSAKILNDVNSAIQTSVTVARNEWKYAADMVLNLDPNLPEVPCLPGELNQVFLNLIVNATHAIREKIGENQAGRGVITISTALVDGAVEVRVQDTGCGVPDSIRHKVFDPFFTTKQPGKGTGQGLAMAHHVIVEQHEGTIDFESHLGVGTTFIIRLPAHAQTSSIGLTPPLADVASSS